MTDIVERLLSFKTDLDKEQAAAEILRLRSALSAMRERAAKVAENMTAVERAYDARTFGLTRECRIAAAIRALPITEDGK